MRDHLHEVREKDLIIFNNVELHGWWVQGESMEVEVMIFPTEFVAVPLTVFDNDYLKPFLERGGNFRNKIEAGEENAEEKNTGYRLMIKAQVLRILTLLIRYYQKDEEKKSNLRLTDKKKSMKRIEEALYYINSHFTEKITLEEAASVACMSPNYFSSYFKKVSRCGFSEYVTKLRLEKVKEMEKTTNLTMYEIAMACGFSNMSNFYRLYKKYGDSSTSNVI